MATKLFVGSLPYATTSEELREVFAKAGKVVDANVVMDKMTGRSRGFGFVEMASDADAKKAVESLNGTEVGGRKIFVSEARPQRQDADGGAGRQEQAASDAEDSSTNPPADAGEPEPDQEEPSSDQK